MPLAWGGWMLAVAWGPPNLVPGAGAGPLTARRARRRRRVPGTGEACRPCQAFRTPRETPPRAHASRPGPGEPVARDRRPSAAGHPPSQAGALAVVQAVCGGQRGLCPRTPCRAPAVGCHRRGGLREMHAVSARGCAGPAGHGEGLGAVRAVGCPGRAAGQWTAGGASGGALSPYGP